MVGGDSETLVDSLQRQLEEDRAQLQEAREQLEEAHANLAIAARQLLASHCDAQDLKTNAQIASAIECARVQSFKSESKEARRQLVEAFNEADLRGKQQLEFEQTRHHEIELQWKEKSQAEEGKWEEERQSWNEERTQGLGLVEECKKQLLETQTGSAPLELSIGELQSEMKQHEEERQAKHSKWEEEQQSWDEKRRRGLSSLAERDKELLDAGAERVRLESLIAELQLEMKEREEKRQAEQDKWEEERQSWDEAKTQGLGLVEERDKELLDAGTERARLESSIFELQSEMKECGEESRAEQCKWEEQRQSLDEAKMQCLSSLEAQILCDEAKTLDLAAVQSECEEARRHLVVACEEADRQKRLVVEASDTANVQMRLEIEDLKVLLESLGLDKKQRDTDEVLWATHKMQLESEGMI